MNKIHILTTHKPSRLLYDIPAAKLNLVTTEYSASLDDKDNYMSFHMFITSSDKEIKANVYALINGVLCKTETREGKIVSRQLSGGATMDICKSEYLEIIMATDPDLIKDGVQAIPDDFLEWYVRNPSCERVEVDDWLDTNSNIAWGLPDRYKIIIPNEESKQHLIDIMKGDEELGLYEEPKQEIISSIEDAEITFANEIKQISEYDKGRWYGRIEGVIWMKEKMYSEEEVLELLPKFASYTLLNADEESRLSLKEWFEQFKKK